MNWELWMLNCLKATYLGMVVMILGFLGLLAGAGWMRMFGKP